ncbi:potassium channel family protein [Streptomyces sp. NPDC127051]|uniref:potassium channel family protein n=1 Tax=Streptomyces sp. NPDC127051 TaxID=3347119 RepID=UPI0036600273
MNRTGSARWQALLAFVRSLVTAGVLVTLYYLLPLDSSFTPTTVVALAVGIAGVALLLAWHIRRIRQSPWPGLRAVEALAVIVPCLVLLFATAYLLMDHTASDSFSEELSRTDALYFAMTVFSTVGFGDITARSEPARLLTTGQMALNFLLIGVAARLLMNAVEESRRQHEQRTAGTG